MFLIDCRSPPMQAQNDSTQNVCRRVNRLPACNSFVEVGESLCDTLSVLRLLRFRSQGQLNPSYCSYGRRAHRPCMYFE